MLVAIAGLSFLVIGCPKVPGRWDHYASGGSFIGVRPSPSPDGKFLVFASPRTGNGDIYRVNIDGSNLERLTRDENYEGDPVYSRDGRSIAFVREQGAIGHIWTMNADGTNPRQVTAEVWYDHWPSFSPDGTRIVFVRQLDGIKFRPGTSASAELFVMNSDGTLPVRLTDNAQPDWTPCFSTDGKRIFYSVYSGSDSVWVMQADGSTPVRLGAGASPSLSRDGKHIVFVSGEYGRAISIMNVDGSSVKEVYRSEANKSDPSFMPDGSRIVFVEEPRGRNGDICILSLADMGLKRVADRTIGRSRAGRRAGARPACQPGQATRVLRAAAGPGPPGVPRE
jgi:Tol biopolymer transport system component